MNTTIGHNSASRDLPISRDNLTTAIKFVSNQGTNYLLHIEGVSSPDQLYTAISHIGLKNPIRIHVLKDQNESAKPILKKIITKNSYKVEKAKELLNALQKS